jgi:trehalose-phosphatase
MKYVFENWQDIENKLKRDFIFLFLDFDGTLSAIAESPQEAELPPQTKEVLKKISESADCKIAIISGRALKDIKEKVGLKEITYSGNHGLEIEGPKIKFRAAVSEGYKRAMEKIKTDLKRKLSQVRGVLLEDKGLSLSLHYRLAAQKDILFIKAAFHEAAMVYLIKNNIKVKPGKKVLEIRPPLEWDKGKIVQWLLARQEAVTDEKKILPLYIGDDLTDEDAFKALKKKGITVFVGEPGRSNAEYYLKDTEEAFELLNRILKIRKKKSWQN